MSSLDINSLKNSKRQQLIDQELVENTEKLNYKSSYFSHKKRMIRKFCVLRFKRLTREQLLSSNSGGYNLNLTKTVTHLYEISFCQVNY